MHGCGEYLSVVVVTGYYPDNVRLCQSFIRHKSTLVSPSVLKQNAIPYDKVFSSFVIISLFTSFLVYFIRFDCCTCCKFCMKRVI